MQKIMLVLIGICLAFLSYVIYLQAQQVEKLQRVNVEEVQQNLIRVSCDTEEGWRDTYTVSVPSVVAFKGSKAVAKFAEGYCKGIGRTMAEWYW